ncbi:MAG: hypothetical protein LBC93_06210 [Synergistaceae bacterium]|jgi:hypothetical protein|nr:hypothetical protein [Synergistaceae bacterium]
MPGGEKYLNLIKYLEAYCIDDITLPFEQIANIVGGLPPSVYSNPKSLSAVLHRALSSTGFALHTNINDQVARFERGAKRVHSYDLTGKRYGRLTVIKKLNVRSRGGKVFWECICDCCQKTICRRTTNDLISGKYKSCGCLVKEARKRNNGKQLASGLRYTDGTELIHLFSTTVPKNNTSGIRGVYLDKRSGKYRASYKYQGKTYYIQGCFSDPNDAKNARDNELRKILEKYGNYSPRPT